MKFAKVQKVSLLDEKTRVVLSCMEGFGIFTVYIEDADHPETGASACFNIAANRNYSSITKAASVTGVDGESLIITWTPDDRPRLSFYGRVNAEFLPKRYLVFAGALSANQLPDK